MLTRLSPKQQVGLQIKRARQVNGITGSELAKILCCSQQRISRIELGQIRIKASQIKIISDVLNVPISYLLSSTGFQYDSMKGINNIENYLLTDNMMIGLEKIISGRLKKCYAR